ncbi:MAG: alpha/beta fold hydrolase [Bacteroidia bacterium]
MKLFHRNLGTEGPWVMILHGLFGSSDNWLTIGKALAENGYRVALTDLRNHGLSPHDDRFDLVSMAEDVNTLITNEGMHHPILIGHSLGGKVAMRYACQFPDQLSAMVVLDIAPKSYALRHHDIVQALLEVSQQPMTSRKMVDEQLSPMVPDFSVRQWLMKSLYWKEKDRLDWRFNLPVIAQSLGQAVANSQCDIPINLPTLFLRGENSNYIEETDFAAIQKSFSNATIETIANAGHWLHADQPNATLEAIVAFLNKLR